MSFRSTVYRPLRVWAPGVLSARRPAALATLLVVGLVLFAPLFALTVDRFAPAVPLPLLFGVMAVGGFYAAFVFLAGDYLRGTAVAIIVTTTFAADLPLSTGAGSYPGSLGPALMLFHLPLLALVGLLAVRGDLTTDSLSPVEYAFGAFVVWSVVVATVGAVPRRDTALYYSLFSLAGLLAFVVARRVVESGTLELSEVVQVFLIAVFGHVAFAIAQVANQGPFGLSMLGETTRASGRVAFDVGPLGEFYGGVLLSGFTGGSGPLSMLLVIAIPTTLAVALRRRGRWRAGFLLAAVVATGVLRATAKDGARGATVVGVALFAGYLLWVHRSRVRELAGRPGELAGRPGRLTLPVTVAAALGLLLLYPSTSRSPGSSEADHGSVEPVVADAVGGVDLTSLTIPFFSLDTLGVRLAQYVVAVDIAVRHPLFGVGGANFPYVAAEYGVPSIEGFPVHNLYLSQLVGTGVPGFLLYCLAIVLVLRSGSRLLRSETSEAVLVAGLLAGLIGVLAALFWVIPLRFTYVVSFWLLAGALVGGDRHLRRAGGGSWA